MEPQVPAQTADGSASNKKKLNVGWGDAQSCGENSQEVGHGGKLTLTDLRGSFSEPRVQMRTAACRNGSVWGSGKGASSWLWEQEENCRGKSTWGVRMLECPGLEVRMWLDT